MAQKDKFKLFESFNKRIFFKLFCPIPMKPLDQINRKYSQTGKLPYHSIKFNVISELLMKNLAMKKNYLL